MIENSLHFLTGMSTYLNGVGNVICSSENLSYGW